MTLYAPDYLLVSSRRYRLQVSEPRYRVAWDDESSTYGYKCRTQSPGFAGPDNPPAVWRFVPQMLAPGQPLGEYYVNMETPYDWKRAIIDLNGSEQDWEYLTKGNPGTATYNKGWPKQSYLLFSGNRLQGEVVGDWFRFETLKPSDLSKVRGMTIETHPWLVHRFTCVTWDAWNKTTKHIESTGTPRGQIYQFVVSNEGTGYIPMRNVIEIGG